MSKVLMIRHLPEELSFQDKEQLLKHFGAEKVWETRSKRHYIFAAFSTVDKAKTSLSRLHQLEIARRRLVVEFANDTAPVTSNEKKSDAEQNSETTKKIKEFLKLLNAWNPSVNFYQPPPVHLKYKYPEINPDIAINIMYTLFTHKPFYVQSIHLMNKMCLSVPFEENPKAMEFFRENFSTYFMDLQLIRPPASETESEISSGENEQEVQPTPKLVKRKRKLPMPKHRPAKLPTAPVIQTQTAKKKVNNEEVFEPTPLHEPKKIMLNIHQDALQKPAEEQEPEVLGELGKFQKEEQPVEIESKEEPEQPTITKKELLRNRISYRDMKMLPVFKNYHPGQPSMRLYIKNLAKTVTEQDVKRIYKLYIEGMTDEELTGFDVRVMQEGRMKGQAFVTFPSVRIAETALNETNGYLLKEKPMVVQFARVANKKTVE